jgi:hypothetical protein
MAESTINDKSNLFESLPTGKPHVSFSELRDWQDCSFRHKLKHVNGIDLSEKSPILDFGTCVHASCEDYLNTRILKKEIAIDSLKECFEKNKDNPSYGQNLLTSYIKEINEILDELPSFLNDNFPEWETVDAEHLLYESINNHPHAFKGFIDGIIKTKDKKGNDQYWIIDWKTSAWGWTMEKKTDFKLHQQLIFYKNFWSTKMNIDPKKIRCGFVLLKRTAKVGSKCELVKVSVGDITSERALKSLSNMLVSVKKGIALKNRDSCTYCPYKNTEHCN